MIVLFETLEGRLFLTAAQDLTSLSALRQDSNYSQIDGSGIGIAVLDSGTWANHPDLRSNFVAFFDAVKHDVNRDLEFAAGSTNIDDAFDPDGHGTHTAGTAASSNPNIGVATGAKLIAVRALPADNEAEPAFDTVANGLQWVLNNVSRFNIKVVNLSLGVPTVNDNTGRISDQESVLIRRLEQVGVTVVAAAGNNYASFAPANGAATPGAYSTLVVSNVWADNGVDADFPVISGSGGNAKFFAQEDDAAADRFAATSQRSTLASQIAAPGENILSTWNDPRKLYQLESGTSMASPFIAGTVALMQETSFNYGGRYLSPDQVRFILLDSADNITDSNVSTNSRIPVRYDASGNPVRAGANQNLPETGRTYKRVDVYAAVRAVRALVTGTAPTTPETPPVSGTDPDATLTTATEVPAINGNAVFDFTGRVGTDGLVAIGTADVDLYKVTVLSTGAISAQLTLPGGGTGFSPSLRLFNLAGVQLASTQGGLSTYPTLVSPRLAAGVYYLGISSVGNEAYNPVTRTGVVSGSGTGDYQLTVGLANPDPNGVPQGAFNLDLLAPDDNDPRTGDLATTVGGTIGSDPNPLNESGPRVQIGGTDVDMFRLVAPDDGILTVDTVAAGSLDHAIGGVNTHIRVFDADFNELNITQDFFGGVDAFTVLPVTRGSVYYIGISSSGNTVYDPDTSFDRASTTGQTGTYDAYFAFDNGDTNGTAFNATPRTIGQTFNAAIGNAGGQVLLGAENGNKDVNFYRITIPASAPATSYIDLQAQPTSANFTPVMALWRLAADRSEITRDADTAGRSARIIAPINRGETLYVSVTGNGNDDFRWFATASGSGGEIGTFQFSSALRSAADVQKLTNGSILNGTPTTAPLDTPIYANLGTTNGVETGAASVNLYRYVATFDGKLTVRASVPNDQPTDPYLRVFDALGTELAKNDDASPRTRDALLTIDVSAGQTYYIGVNPSSADSDKYNPLTGEDAAPGTEGDYILLLSGPPRLSISTAAVQPTDTGADVVTFTITLAAPAALPVTANFATYAVGGPNGAVPGVDFTPVSTPITLAPGQTATTVTVPFVRDSTPGKTRLVGATLSNITNARKGQLDAAAPILPESSLTPSTTAPDLITSALTLTPKGPITPADRVAASLSYANAGVGTLAGRFSLRTVISSDPYASPDDILLAPARTLSLKLTQGRTAAMKLTLAIPSALEAGTWYAVSTFTPLTGNVAGNDASADNNTVVSTPFNVEWLFGTFAGHTNKKLTLPSADGTFITFSLSGPGTGTVTRDDANFLSASLASTTAKSVFSLTAPRRATADVLNLAISSPLKSLLAKSINVLGDLTLPSPTPKTIQILGR